VGNVSILEQHEAQFRAWGLFGNPFRPTPPEDPADVVRVFAGRQKEMELTLPTLYEGNNVLVRGMWGVGKTIFILAALHRLQREAAALKSKVLTVYVRRFLSEKPEDLCKAILLPLTDLLSDKDQQAKQIREAMREVRITRAQSKTVSAEASVHLFSLGAELGGTTDMTVTLDSPQVLARELLVKARKRHRRVIIAIDDLDKKDPVAVQDMLDETSEDLRSDLAAFILTGRTLTVAQDAYAAALGLFNESLYLQPLPTSDLYQVAVNYFNTVRAEPNPTPAPLTEDVIQEIGAKAYGIPRQFNLICEKMLRAAARHRYSKIDQEAFAACFEELRDDVGLTMTPEVRHILHVAQKVGGFSEDLDDEILDQLGVTTFVELLPAVNYLIQNDLMIRLDYERGIRYIPSSLVKTD
jgi:hypothetical protein